MSFTHQITRTLIAGGQTLTLTETVTANAERNVDETIANGQTDFQIDFDLDVSACKSFWIESNKDITVETNAVDASGGNTLALKANEVYEWNENSLDAFKLTEDVTTMYVTNASGATATLKIRSLVDPTP